MLAIRPLNSQKIPCLGGKCEQDRAARCHGAAGPDWRLAILYSSTSWIAASIICIHWTEGVNALNRITPTGAGGLGGASRQIHIRTDSSDMVTALTRLGQ